MLYENKGKNKHGNIRCEGCSSYNMKAQVSFDGLDCDSEAGEGSGFKWEICLVCEECSRTYPIGRVKEVWDFSHIREE